MLDRIIGILAPHRCLNCCKDGNLLCENCAMEVAEDRISRCYICHTLTADASICKTCLSKSSLDGAFICVAYEDVIEKLIKAYKFERVKAASKPLAGLLDLQLPAISVDAESMLVTAIPTAAKQIRQRGYDHVGLLGRELASMRGLEYAPLLRRHHQLRQLGASRSVRRQQAESAFYVNKLDNVRDKTVILIDDVVTTGATIEAAARCLKAAGAAHVVAIAVAMQRHK